MLSRLLSTFSVICLVFFCSFAGTHSAQAQIEIQYPYNPDSDGDEVIGSADLLSLLSVFGLQFELDSIYIDGIGLDAFLLELTEAVLELQNNSTGSGFGVVEILENEDESLTFVFSDGTEFVSPPLPGNDGQDGVDGEDGLDGQDGADGLDGQDGLDGDDGADGLSAYEIWLAAGNTGTEEDFMTFLTGANLPDGNIDGQILVWNGSGWAVAAAAVGCMNLDACNFDADATISYPDACFYLDACGVCNGPGAIYTCGCADIPTGYCDCDGNIMGACGCTFESADNYDPNAFIEDNSCVWDDASSICDHQYFYFYENYSYDLVAIGNQCWFTENLRNQHYSNGEEIQNDLTNSEWEGALEGAYGFSDDTDFPAEEYGYLYNWYAVNDERGICPSGWHVPSDEEWMVLEVELGMDESDLYATESRGTDQGLQLKASVENSPSWDGTNSSGFTALPSGTILYNGNFVNPGSTAHYWTTSMNFLNFPIFRQLSGGNDFIIRGPDYLQSGKGVRCVKDSE